MVKRTVKMKEKKVIGLDNLEGAPIFKKEETNEQAQEKEIKKENVLVPQVDQLQPGQKYFETPDGELIIGEESKGQIWHRKLNNGKGGWVNPKR